MSNDKYKPFIISTLIGLAMVGVSLVIKGKRFKEASASKWSSDPNFFVTSKGINLSALAKKVGINLSRNKGIGGSYSEANYKKAKTNPNVYWAIYDIQKGQLLASSSQAKTNVYGASVPKVLVASAALSKNKGTLPNQSDYENLIKLLVKSDNNAWTPIQNIAGGADYVNLWAKSMGYNMQPARGKGNQSNAIDMCKFWGDVCNNNFEGAEVIFRITSSCQTSASRSRKYMPTNVFIGDKTGTYESSNHDCAWIESNGRFYSISVLTNLGSNGTEVIANMFRGLYDEYIKN